MLCVLAGRVLQHTFPDLDDFQIAELYNKQKCDDSPTVSSLLDQCKATVISINPQTDTEDLLKGRMETSNSSKNSKTLDYTEYLKKLAFRKTN